VISSSNSASRRARTLSPSQSDKVSFLSVPEHYRERTRHVFVIQTHHAWVFLTDKHAYKMKKPSRHGRLDFSSLESRHHLCTEELRLNRRLARQTYIGVVPLVIGQGQKLELGADGTVVEWLVKMRRLSDTQLLHNAASGGRASSDDIACLMRKLFRFYRNAPVCNAGEIDYPVRLEDELDDLQRELARPEFQIPGTLRARAIDRQADYIERHRTFLQSRQRDGAVREVHGDLRPEHICLMPDAEPEIIDCLEFDRALRCLDYVEELAYLGLECRVIDQRWIEEEIIEWYEANSSDKVPMHLWRFYAARRATTRAMLCAWHTLDAHEVNPWFGRGREYLRLAQDYLDASANL